MNPTALGLGSTCPSLHSPMSSQVCNKLYIPQLEHDVKVVMVLDKWIKATNSKNFYSFSSK